MITVRLENTVFIIIDRAMNIAMLIIIFGKVYLYSLIFDSIFKQCSKPTG